MAKLPRYIADLCGIIDEEEYIPGLGRPSLSNPVKTVQDHDGVWTMTYGVDEMGWISKLNVQSRDGHRYRAVSVHGAFKHCDSLNSARSFIMAEYI
jgi:hypothetical protein